MEEGTLLTSARLGALNLTDPDVLDMTGVLPYACGNDSSVAPYRATTRPLTGSTSSLTLTAWCWGWSP